MLKGRSDILTIEDESSDGAVGVDEVSKSEMNLNSRRD